MIESPSRRSLFVLKTALGKDYRPRTIAFVMASGNGHIIPTFGLARAFAKRGLSIQYIGFDESRQLVEAQGFGYISLGPKARLFTVQQQLLNGYIQRAIVAARNLISESVDKLNGLADPLVFIDVDLQPMLAACVDSGIPAIVIHATLRRLPPSTFYAPVSSFAVEARSSGERLLNFFRWARLCAVRLRPDHLFSGLVGPDRWIRKVAAKYGLSIREAYDGPVLDHVPVLLCSSRFNRRIIAPRCVHIYDAVDARRSEEGYGEWATHHMPTVLCTLGSDAKRYKCAPRFFKMMLDLADKHSDHFFIIQTGNAQWSPDGPVASNCRIQRWVPTLAIISEAVAVIYHGGLGTMKECIHYRVPTVVWPCRGDQFGNSALTNALGVGIGLRGPRSDAKELSSAFKAIRTEKRFAETLAAINLTSNDWTTEAFADCVLEGGHIATRPGPSLCGRASLAL